MASNYVTPLVAIVGQTGTGKSTLAMELARRFNSEIIAADSRTVYKGMDIGTAKPTAEERQAIAHYGLDAVEPGEKFSVYDFKRLALQSIEEIARKGKLSLLVGGTGLYVDALLYDFSFRPPADAARRASLDNLSVGQLQDRITRAGLPLPENSANPRYLRRVLESGPAPAQPKIVRPNTLILGLRAAQDILRARITVRVEQMVAAGLVDEVRALMHKYGGIEALRAPGYKAFAGYIEGTCSIAEAKRAFIHNDMQLAKRQLTWFKRNKNIRWLDTDNPLDEATEILAAFLDTQGSAFATI